MTTLIFASLASLAYMYVFWCAYVLTMRLYRAHLAGWLTGMARKVCTGLLDSFDPNGNHCG